MADILIDTKTTDANGVAAFTNLPAGSYKYVQAAAPTGYTKDPAEYTITVTANPPTVTVTKTNTPTRVGELQIFKHEEGAIGTPLPNATFTLMKDGKVMQDVTVASSAAGIIPLPNLMSIPNTPQSYTVQEVTPPTGYFKNGNPYTQAVTVDQTATQNVPNLKMGTSELDVSLKDVVYTQFGLAGSDYNLYYQQP